MKINPPDMMTDAQRYDLIINTDMGDFERYQPAEFEALSDGFDIEIIESMLFYCKERSKRISDKQWDEIINVIFDKWSRYNSGCYDEHFMKQMQELQLLAKSGLIEDKYGQKTGLIEESATNDLERLKERVASLEAALDAAEGRLEEREREIVRCEEQLALERGMNSELSQERKSIKRLEREIKKRDIAIEELQEKCARTGGDQEGAVRMGSVARELTEEEKRRIGQDFFTQLVSSYIEEYEESDDVVERRRIYGELWNFISDGEEVPKEIKRRVKALNRPLKKNQKRESSNIETNNGVAAETVHVGKVVLVDDKSRRLIESSLNKLK